MTNLLRIGSVIPTWSLRGKEATFISQVNNCRNVMAAIPNIDATASRVLIMADHPATEERQIISRAVSSALEAQPMNGNFNIEAHFLDDGTGLGFKKFKGLEAALKSTDLAVLINDNPGHPPENIASMAAEYLARNFEMIIGARDLKSVLEKLPADQLFFEARANQMVQDLLDFGDVFGSDYQDFVMGMLAMSQKGWQKLATKIVQWESQGKISFWKATEEIGFGFDVFTPILGKAAGLNIGCAPVTIPDYKAMATTQSGFEGRQRQFGNHITAIGLAKRVLTPPVTGWENDEPHVGLEFDASGMVTKIK